MHIRSCILPTSLTFWHRTCVGAFSFFMPTLTNDELMTLREIYLCDLEKLRKDASLNLILKVTNTCMRTSAAMISIVDDTHQHILLSTNANNSSIEKKQSFCYYSIKSGKDIFVSHDTLLDPSFKDNPPNPHNHNIRFYASALLKGPNNAIFGNLCVVDYKYPHWPLDLQLKQLRWLGDLVSLQLEKIDQESKSSITNLYMIDKLQHIGQLEFNLALRNGTQLILCILNLNGFSLINRTLGHAAGNSFLHECADLLQTLMLDDDLIFSLEPDRFAVLMNIKKDMLGVDIAQSLQHKLGQLHISNAPTGYKLYPVIGLGFLNPHDQTFNDLFIRAEKALSLAEMQGNGAMVELHDGHNNQSIGCTHRVGQW